MRDPAEDYRLFVVARYSALLHTAWLLTGDRQRAEDLVQDSLVKLWFKWRRVDTPEAYVRKIMTNGAIQAGRRAWWRERPTAEPPEQAGPDDPTGRVDERDGLLAALTELPAKQRAIVILRYAEDLPMAEVARLLDCSVGTVKSQASRGLARLRAATASASTPAVPVNRRSTS